MKRIVNLKLWLLLAVVCLSLNAGAKESHAFGGFIFRSPFSHRHHHHQRRAPSYWETYHYMNSRYPKYIGGFHASYFRDMGIAPGDVGLRGNSIYPTPW